MGLSLKNIRSADFCAERIDIITNFAVIRNAIINTDQISIMVVNYYLLY